MTSRENDLFVIGHIIWPMNASEAEGELGLIQSSLQGQLVR